MWYLLCACAGYQSAEAVQEAFDLAGIKNYNSAESRSHQARIYLCDTSIDSQDSSITLCKM